MRLTPEGEVKAALKLRLTELGMYWFMPVQSGYGTRGLDFYTTWQGWFIAIETKRPGKDWRPDQRLIADAIERAGGIAIKIDTVKQAQTFDPSTVIPRPTPGARRLQDDRPGAIAGFDWLR